MHVAANAAEAFPVLLIFPLPENRPILNRTITDAGMAIAALALGLAEKLAPPQAKGLN
jgi:hypothetical protein